jgi:hypothetical protein
MAGTWNRASMFFFPCTFTHYWALRQTVGTSAMAPKPFESYLCRVWKDGLVFQYNANPKAFIILLNPPIMTLHALQTLPLLQKLIHVQMLARIPSDQPLDEAYAAPPMDSLWLRSLRSISEAAFQLGIASPVFAFSTRLIRRVASSCTSITVTFEALV